MVVAIEMSVFEAQYGRKINRSLKNDCGCIVILIQNNEKSIRPIGNKLTLNCNLQGVSITIAQPGLQVLASTCYKRMKNRDGGTNPNLIAWNAYVGYQFNENSSLRLDARNLLNRHNVISNGDWEYWDEPFNYQLSYTQKF